MTARARNTSNACGFCGEQVTTRTRLEGFTAWENAEGEIAAKETVVVVHPECWLRATPAEREALLEKGPRWPRTD